MTKSIRNLQVADSGSGNRPAKAASTEMVSAARSRIMKSIGQKHTRPEVFVRRLIHRMGFRFRLHQQKLPGKPDIILRRHGAIIQVNGCFWHQHGCSISNVPRTRTEYWLPKLARNVERDRIIERLLISMGWRVLTVWECELKDDKKLSRDLRRFITNSHSKKHATSGQRPSRRRSVGT